MIESELEEMRLEGILINTVLMDIDGVLTNGNVTIDSSGLESKSICFDDIDAIFELKRKNIKIGFISGEDNSFTAYIKKRFEPDFFISGSKDKLSAFQELAQKNQFVLSEVAYVGDSKKDAPLLSFLNHSYAPSNADPIALRAAKKKLKSPRGSGVIRELAECILDVPMSSLDSNEKLAQSFWVKSLEEHLQVIQQIHSDKNFIQLLDKIAMRLVEVFQIGGKVLICGNGGSAADAQHIAGELVSRFFIERRGLYAEALSANIASITAIGNDYSYEKVFQRQVEANARSGDLLIGLSTSGGSKNVILAMEEARKKGVVTVGITGVKPNAPILAVSDYSIQIPSLSTPRIQEAYLLVCHMICEFVEAKLFG